METSELMIGDLVKLKSLNYYYKVECVFYNAIRILCGSATEDHEIDKFEPIPLTKEILETNGLTYDEKWEQYSFPKEYEEINKVGFGVEHFKDEWVITDHCLMKMVYVHQFQHALRLMGLNDLANNFKIQ